MKPHELPQGMPMGILFLAPMKDQGTTDNCWLFRLLVIGVLALGAARSQVWGQPTIAVQESLDSFALVERWVRDWEVPNESSGEAEGQWLPEVCVAIVTLRLDGRVFGRGASAELKPTPGMIRRAASMAINNANSKLTKDRDAMWDSFLADLSGRVTITLEIADGLVPISSSELEHPGFGYTPGVYGVAVARGDRVDVLGPGSMLARNTDMTQSAMALANGLAGDGSVALLSPLELVEAGYRFYRFEPVVLAQPGGAMGASFIDRGGRVVDQSEISMRSIAELERQVAKHLMGRRWAGVERYGLMGALDPVTGKTASMFASPFEQAISAYALLRFGEDAQSKFEREAVLVGRGVLVDLGRVEPGEVSPWDDGVGSCMVLIALSQIPLIDILGDDQLNELRLRCLETLDGMYTAGGGFGKAVPEGARGLVAYALVRSAMLDPRDRSELALGATVEVLTDVLPTSLVGQMPFLGWAGDELEDQLDGEFGAIWTDVFVQMRSLIWDHQLVREDLDWVDRDLAGGVVFTNSSTPLPSWLATKPLAYVATMLGNERMTPGTLASDDLRQQIDHQVRAVRFVRQLCVDGEHLHMYASREQAIGGVRRALWDQHLSVEVSAMALLALSETRRSFEAILERTSSN